MEKETHTLNPIYDEYSKILILGSFPSVQSRKKQFYYAHPQNQFWKLLSDVFNEDIQDKIDFLKQRHIALWDVIKSCSIEGSKDSSIKNVEVNDIQTIIQLSKIKTIFTTGKKAYQLYKKYLEKDLGIKAVYLPSSSPLYASITYQNKLTEYLKIKDYL